ncbi:ROK family glucokinase [Heyndrickxia sporothermodurans]|uniref:Glucokinase n=1 Tax=Heyndrickxia sporothermodurans TaxID=46224 RepID=A0A150KM09_9BACI|nr:ROK family glucokinase [Heyndrickxia sporothermodurans]KYC95068.1 Glucokinase [Heyndrickxia sporothermodurans]MBL5766057.1 ROK family glucokinase [Heyndrickxia sporothermodurans]MBL5769498.1 ROK family glucokinase [Heyndrickxia sporothermodurans]MBL5773279.1 ROK family glucokinase [Heyndrickxia sporothermodurans]MBL5780500.1 ROK family glucokinase [Heyndrickxia sporothermodurans]
MTEKWIAGIDLGGTTTKLAFINENGDIVHKWEIDTDNSEKGKNILKNISDSIDQKLERLNKEKEILLGIGIGVPGAVDLKKGIIYEAVNLGWEDNLPVVQALGELTGLPVAIDNDANCAALGEMWKGAGQGAKDLLCVTLGTGVGGGVIVNKQIVHGVKGAAGEIGHITVIPENGSPCNCGKTGCLETVASATGISRIATENLHTYKNDSRMKDIFAKQGRLSAKDVFDCANENDQLAKKIVDQVAFYLGLTLANIGNSLNPEKIVIGGGVSKAGDTLLAPISSYFRKFAFSTVAQSTSLHLATLGNDAGVIGAAWLIKSK